MPPEPQALVGLTNLQLLQKAKTNVLTLICQVTSEQKPTYSINGQNISWESYLNSLREQVDKLNELILEEQPFIVTSIGTT
jgi:hypothetical protein